MPQKQLKPGWDAIASLVKLFHDNPLLTEAKQLEEQAREIELDEAAESCHRALGNPNHVSERLEEAHRNSKEVEATYTRMRGRAEREFDQTTRGTFQFGDVARALDLADRACELANQTYLTSDKAVRAALSIAIEFDNDPYNQLARGVTNHTADALRDAAQLWPDRAISIRNRSDALRQTLRALRATADEALAKAPGAGTPR